MSDSYQFTLESKFGSDELLLSHATIQEGLSSLFFCELELKGTQDDRFIELEEALGEPMTVIVTLPTGEERFFNGIVSELSHTGSEGNITAYHATLVPWLWLLGHKTDCRMFQEKAIPDILEQVFGDAGFDDYELQLSGTYEPWEYCVQYRESDLNFVSRLMEQEGMYYFFEHEKGKHTLVIADHAGAHVENPGFETIPFMEPSARGRRTNGIDNWSLTKRVKSSQFVLRDFNFKTPATDLQANDSCAPDYSYAHSDFEVFDYPGEYVDGTGGSRYATIRAEESFARHAEVAGGGGTPGIAVGCKFELTDFPRDDQNMEYLVVSATHHLEAPDSLTRVTKDRNSRGAAADEQESYRVSFSAIDARTTFRPARTTRKPTVQGLQTAIVTGPAGEEIHTDEFGRVKVQFHWDREGKKDEDSSCWIRTSQIWAGKNWGGQFLPRIGQEVIVDFLEGDPDRPIITGRVYNFDNKTPFTLPDDKTQSGIKTRSSKQGTDENCNIIRFEDRKDEEQLYIQAEKNQDIKVKNDETHLVGHDRSKKIDNDEQSEIANNRTETVGADETITIGANRKESVGADEEITIGKNQTISVAEDRSETVGNSETVNIGKDRTVDIGAEESVSVGKSRSQSIAQDDELSAGKTIVYEAGDEIVLKTGSASITMKKNGDITIDGKNLTLKASGKINAKASGAIAMKGTQIKQN